MLKIRSGKISIFLFLLCLVFVSSAACSSASEISLSKTQTPVASAGEDQNNFDPIVICPIEPTRYQITYFHYQHLNIDPGTGETVDMTWENSTDAGEIRVWIDENGNITPYEENDPIAIYVSGVAVHPDSDDCPEQTLSGVWELDSTLTGKCVDGNIKIDIKHFYVSSDLVSSCGEIPPMVNSIVSGPEQTLKFDLTEDLPSIRFEIGEGTLYHVNYAYYFTRDEMFLELVPLVPEGE